MLQWFSYLISLTLVFFFSFPGLCLTPPVLSPVLLTTSTFPVLSHLYFPSLLYPSICKNGRPRAGAAQSQLLLCSHCSRQPQHIWGRGQRGPESDCVPPAQTLISASGRALQSGGLLLSCVHNLLSDGYRLPAALELLHNSQTLLALQTE